MEAGKPFGLQPGHTSSIRRIEAAMLSYHADMNINTNPFELGLDRLVDLNMEPNFIGKAALRAIQARGISRLLVGLEIDGLPLKGPNTKHWPLKKNGDQIGHVTSAIYSPRLKKNIALGMVKIAYQSHGTSLVAETEMGERSVFIVEKPFYDPAKTIVRT